MPWLQKYYVCEKKGEESSSEKNNNKEEILRSFNLKVNIKNKWQ